MDSVSEDTQVFQYKLQKDLLDAQTAWAQSEKALIDARRALTEAQRASNKTLDAGSASADTTNGQRRKSIVNEQGAVPDSRPQAALSPYIGELKSGPYSGSVNLKGAAGTQEALLLAACAVKEAGQKISEAVVGAADTFFLFTPSQAPSFAHLNNFRLRLSLIQQAFAEAVVQSAEPKSPSTSRASVLSAGLISAGLDAGAKLLSFFKTDYEVGGIETQIDDSLLLYSVAGALRRPATSNAAAKSAYLPLFYGSAGLAAAQEAILRALGELDHLRAAAAAETKILQASVADVESHAAEPKNADTKTQLLSASGQLRARLDQLNSVVTLYDSFSTSLSTPDANEMLPIGTIAQEWALDTALQSGRAAILIVRLENSGGGYLVKKNLWTVLGSMPLFHMGGATAGYLLLDGVSGEALAGGIVPVYGGFVKSDMLRGLLSGRRDR